MGQLPAKVHVPIDQVSVLIEQDFVDRQYFTTKSSAKSAKSDAQKYVPSRRDSSPARLSALVTLHLSAKTRDGARA
jgi:hypothetical protein